MKKIGTIIGTIILLIAIVLLSSAPVFAEKVAAPATDTWSAFSFLLGEWVGEGSGAPGQGEGSFSFQFDLDKKILVRRNRTDFPATKNRPAVSHQDLMVIYNDKPGQDKKAVYFDNEEHVIGYTVTSGKEGEIIFTSQAAASSPHFRLTYTKLAEDRCEIKFEMSTPDKPDDFKLYLKGTAKRKS